ncbi:type II toxin-antitoxin system RelE/ParE family toxin [Pseudomonas putida]|uniref:type II toxin-antitoxin system RelE/ParE family toxin n=1 Tax=Pseudomonas sp. p1(2021b) TaxID=2874628 RepID=UPI001CCA4DA3|nr:type II toxin-antitoxin system RelE/ParE family toxin [Pseudomonas sp. p1(2021b)]EKT4520884.1 type II toxin-antitoxin system RelE/ParE family toxin [Pseudomonas putida]UBM27583.1 type II toxin-antitoxin system RelE/ParE family toxin [Pseudomonas sp. p1(2021b)]
MNIYKRRAFARWQVSENLPDTMLCKAVEEMRNGLVDASLGGLLFKKRIGGGASGKRGGYRTLLSARIGDRYVFLHGFAKNEKANVTPGEQKALQFVGRVFLEMSVDALAKALASSVLMEVCCEQQTD